MNPFTWHELLTNDEAAARAFYEGLLGWKAIRVRPSGKLAPHWVPFLTVDDPAMVEAAVVPAGGRIAGHVDAVGGAPVVLDPHGTPTVAMSARPAEAGFAWNILESRDPAVSTRFYGAVYGWTVPARGGWWVGEEQVGSLIPGSHDRWLSLAVVDDLAAILERAVVLGGRVEGDTVEVPGQGRYAVVLDPQGAAFCPFQGS